MTAHSVYKRGAAQPILIYFALEPARKTLRVSYQSTFWIHRLTCLEEQKDVWQSIYAAASLGSHVPWSSGSDRKGWWWVHVTHCVAWDNVNILFTLRSTSVQVTASLLETVREYLILFLVLRLAAWWEGLPFDSQDQFPAKIGGCYSFRALVICYSAVIAPSCTHIYCAILAANSLMASDIDSGNEQQLNGVQELD